MNTLTNSLLKRALSILLVTIMVFSLGIVSITTTSAAEVELVETSADDTFTVYFENNWLWTDVCVYYWKNNNAYPGKDWPGVAMSSSTKAPLVDTTNGKVFEAQIPSDADGFKFSGIKNDGSGNRDQSPNITDKINGRFYSMTWNNGNQIVTNDKYVVTGPVTSEKLLWADVDGDVATSDVNDRVYVEKHQSADCYILYLPAGMDTTKLILKTSEGTNVTVDGKTVDTDGTEYNASSIIPNANGKYTMTGDFAGSLYIRQSANIPSLHTITESPVPMKEAMNSLGSKNDYNSENDSKETGDNTQFITYRNADKTLKLDNGILSKVKGRGNSSWEVSNKFIGKYAFNITLGSKTNLLGSGDSKKYCLVSYNADEARMRNMIAYELADKIGLEFSPKFQPIDLYNNGRYIGSYLLTDKVEIGEPLVKITDLDKANKKVNAAIYEDETFTKATSGTSGSAGYKMYASNLIDPGLDAYKDSGFLLELELYDRFESEFSGFISSKGQEVVCKYPEYATKAQIDFISGKWNAVESLIYENPNVTYKALDELIDVESFAKMYLIQELSKNLDTCSTSYYVYYHEGKLHAGVSWDFDWAFGQYKENGGQGVDAQTTGKFKSDNNGLQDIRLNSPEGWWANSRRIYLAEGNLNIQAQLCQQDAFWDVVKAEWNESFYEIAKSYVTASVVSTSNLSSTDTLINEDISSKLSGGIKKFYQDMRMSTYIDEAKWEIIKKDPIPADWRSNDTGDTHNRAVIFLNNFILNRLNWMNTGATEYHLNSTDYTIQPPVLSLATDMPEGGFDINTEVTINIEDKTGGSYNYKIYKNGEFVRVTTDKSFTVKAENGEFNYTVEAVSQKTNGLSSAQSTPVTVKGTGYAITPSLKVSSTAVLTGDTVTLTPSITENYTDVAYEIYYSVDGGEAQLLKGTTYTQNTSGEVQFYVVATATVDGETVFGSTETKPVKVTFSEFSIKVTTSGNGTVMQSQNVTITATPSVEGDVTYTFYKNDEVITGYENVTTNTYTEKMDDAGSFVYKVVANYAGKTAEGTVTVTVQEFDGTFKVKVLFKSSTVGAYRPNMKINGSAVTLTEETAIEVDKVGDGISTYRWFSYTLPGDQTYGTPITVEVEGNRDYFYKASYSFEVGNTEYPYDSADGFTSYYFALDNLNKRGGTLSNLSGLEAYVRNWTYSATHMIYNDKYDGELSAPVGFSFRYADYGDANCDGKINIKDATYVQKSLANIVVADSLSTTVSDFNKDGKVTIKDATAIQKRIAGL